MMSSKKEYPSAIKTILEIKQEVFEKVVSDMGELYKKGRFLMFFVGPGTSATSFNEDEKVLMKKYSFSKRELRRIISAMLACIHYNLFDEIELISGDLTKKDAGNFKKKASFVSGIMANNPEIEKSFHTYSLSKINFFAGIDWETEIKVFHSPHEYFTKPPTLPVGRIRIHSLDNSEFPPKEEAFQFEITSKDLKTLINYLEDMHRALQNLETARVVPKGDS
jgi:hypothetical protein